MKQIVSIIALVFSLFTCASLGVFAQQSDASLLGFKGQVKSVHVKDNNALLYQFDEQGMFNTFSMQVGLRYFDAQLVYRADKYYSGLVDCEEMFYDSEFDLSETNYKVYFTSGRISRTALQFVIEGEYYFDTYSIVFNAEQVYKYNERGEVSAMSIDFKLDDELKQLSKQKIESQHFTFKNYVYDEYGNWTSRDCYSNNTLQGTEARTIVYYPRFLSQQLYEKALETDDMDEMKRLAMDSENASDEVRRNAAKCWNEHLAREINGKYKYQWEQLFDIMSTPVINADNRAKIEAIVRQHVWDTRVLPERDFQKVKDMTGTTYKGWRVFDTNYANRIKQRSDQLRTDSISRLYQAACYEYNQKRYQQAIRTLHQLLNIDSNNQSAQDLLTGANYYILQDRIQQQTVSEYLFDDFLAKYPGSKYQAEVEDQYATYLLQKWSTNHSPEIIDQLKTMSVNDAKLSKKVSHAIKRQNFLRNRGKLLHWGFGGDFQAGVGMLGGSGEIGLRVGYVPSLLNFYVGARFGVLTSTKVVFRKDKDAWFAQDGYLRFLRAAVPLQVRLNFAKNYERAWYLGLGADINFNINPQIRTVSPDGKSIDVKPMPGENTKDWVRLTTCSPRLSIGVCGKMADFEVFGLYDLQQTFDTEYMQSVGINNHMNDRLYNEQTKDRWRVGAALRFCF